MGEKLNHVGHRLRVAREELGLDIDEVSQRLKVSSEYLRALELGDVTRLPELVYVTGYITGYARILGLPSEELVKSYREDEDVCARDPAICFAKLEIQLEHVGSTAQRRSKMPMLMVPLFLVALIAVIWLQGISQHGLVTSLKEMAPFSQLAR